MAAPSETQTDDEKFYSDAKNYWAGITPTLDGMLGGFAKISPTDINGSKEFLRSYLKISGGTVSSNRALDCGAGIGRITKRLLLPIFEKVDMVEQDQHFCVNARDFIGAEGVRVGNIYCSGLQEFVPAEKTYDLIWCQWVLGHLTDGDLVKFFQRCKSGLNDGGIIIIKENVLDSDERAFDDNDSSYTRTMEEFKKCFLSAGLTIRGDRRQKGFPKDIYPVHMFAVH